MDIKLWGVRGSCPRPLGNEEYAYNLKKILEYALTAIKKNPEASVESLFSSLSVNQRIVIGGNTTCVEVKDANEQIIIDLGTGSIALGAEIVKNNKTKAKKELNIFITHTHWDHIQGWLFFAPAYLPEYTINFYSCIKDLEQRLSHQQQSPFFPVSLKQMLAKQVFHYVPADDKFSVPPFSVATRRLIHPGTSVAYKIWTAEKTFIFATDVEIFPLNNIPTIKKYHDYFLDVDLLVMDGQYSVMDAVNRQGWGHTAMLTCIDCALDWNVKHLVVTHHEPSYTDAKIWNEYDNASEYLKNKGADKDIKDFVFEIAQEGRTYHLGDHS